MKTTLFTFFLCAFVIIALFTMTKSNAQEITIAADYWCPINCKPNTASEGLLVDIAKNIFSKEGYTVNYIQIPWNRAVKMARLGEIDGIIGAFKGDAPDFIFPDNEQLVLTNAFYALNTSNIVLNNTDYDLLKNIKLGIVDGYDYGFFLNQHIKTSDNENMTSIFGDKNLISRLLALLELKRVDVIVDVDIVIQHAIAKQSKEKLFKQVGSASSASKAYIAFSPNKELSLRYSQILSRGMDTIRTSGELDKLMRKYSVNASNNTK